MINDLTDNEPNHNQTRKPRQDRNSEEYQKDTKQGLTKVNTHTHTNCYKIQEYSDSGPSTKRHLFEARGSLKTNSMVIKNIQAYLPSPALITVPSPGQGS